MITQLRARAAGLSNLGATAAALACRSHTIVGWEEPAEGEAADALFEFEDEEELEDDDGEGGALAGEKYADDGDGGADALLELESGAHRGGHGARHSEAALHAARRSRGVRSKQMGLSPDAGGDLDAHHRHAPRTRTLRHQKQQQHDDADSGAAARFSFSGADAAADAGLGSSGSAATQYIGRTAGGPEGHTPGLNCRCDQYTCACKRSCACRLLGDDGAQTAPAPGSAGAAAAAAAGPGGAFGHGNASIVRSRLLESHGGIAPPSRMREAAYLFRCDCGFTIDASDSQFDSLACGCEPEKCSCKRKCTCDWLPRGE